MHKYEVWLWNWSQRSNLNCIYDRGSEPVGARDPDFFTLSWSCNQNVSPLYLTSRIFFFETNELILKVVAKQNSSTEPFSGQDPPVEKIWSTISVLSSTYWHHWLASLYGKPDQRRQINRDFRHPTTAFASVSLSVGQAKAAAESAAFVITLATLALIRKCESIGPCAIPL